MCLMCIRASYSLYEVKVLDYLLLLAAASNHGPIPLQISDIRLRSSSNRPQIRQQYVHTYWTICTVLTYTPELHSCQSPHALSRVQEKNQQCKDPFKSDGCRSLPTLIHRLREHTLSLRTALDHVTPANMFHYPVSKPVPRSPCLTAGRVQQHLVFFGFFTQSRTSDWLCQSNDTMHQSRQIPRGMYKQWLCYRRREPLQVAKCVSCKKTAVQNLAIGPVQKETKDASKSAARGRFETSPKELVRHFYIYWHEKRTKVRLIVRHMKQLRHWRRGIFIRLLTGGEISNRQDQTNKWTTGTEWTIETNGENRKGKGAIIPSRLILVLIYL